MILAVQKSLLRRGRTVDCGFDGRDAIELIKRKDYDILFVDENMSELTGFEVIGQIRKSYPKKVKKIILISGYPTLNEEFAILMGADGYLKKPFQIQEIISIIEKLDKPRGGKKNEKDINRR